MTYIECVVINEKEIAMKGKVYQSAEAAEDDKGREMLLNDFGYDVLRNVSNLVVQPKSLAGYGWQNFGRARAFASLFEAVERMAPVVCEESYMKRLNQLNSPK